MNTSEQRILASLWLVIVFGAFGAWLAIFSAPKEPDIAAKLQPPAPLPVVSVQQLTQQQAAGREIQGSLPIDLNAAGLGRQDPFASQ